MNDRARRFSRRAFLRTAVGGAAGLAGLGSASGQEQGDAPRLPRRQLPGTDLELSILGYGAEFMVDSAIANYLIEKGVTYIDTAATYQNGQSEAKLASVIAEHGDQIVVTTKWRPPTRDGQMPKEWFLESFEQSCERLGVDRLELIQLHDCRDPVEVDCPGGYEAFCELRDAGRVKWYGLSMHLQQPACLSKAVELGYYDVGMIAYNFMSTQAETDAMRRAQDAGMGLVTMKIGKPLTEGRDWWPRATEEDLAILAQAANLFTASLKWNLAQPFITAVVVYMENYDECDQDVAAASEALTAQEAEALRRYARVMSNHVCRGCATCQGVCPEGLAIPDMLRFATYYTGYGQGEQATRHYRRLEPHRTFAACTRCGLCEEACPHSLPILRRLARAHSLMAQPHGSSWA